MRLSGESARDGAQSIHRAIAVLRIVAGGQESGVRLAEVAAATALNRPTVHRILRALMEEGAVEQDGATRRYMIGREVSLMGLARPTGFPIRSLAAPYLRELSNGLGDTCFLTIRNGDDSVCLDRAVGSYPIKVLSIEIGARRLLGVGVSGVVLLASLPPEEALQIMARNAGRLSSLRLDAQDLLVRCERTRQTGYAYAANGVVRGTRAVAVPVQSGDGRTLAGIAVTAVTSRLPESRLPAIVQTLNACAARIGAAWGQRQG